MCKHRSSDLWQTGGSGGFRVATAIAVVLTLSVSAVAQDPNTVNIVRNFTPADWQLDPVPWAGDVDQDVDRPRGLLGPCEETRALRPVGEVAGEAHGFAPGRPDPVGRLGQPGVRARREDQG